MSYEILKWDTNFFGFAIGRISGASFTPPQFESLLKEAKCNGIALLYWFTNPEDEVQQTLAHLYQGFLADQKVTYTKNINSQPKATPDLNIESYSSAVADETMKSLALQSAEYSRFKIDPGFDEDAHIRLYEQWIHNSVNRAFANEVLVFKDNKDILGMITLSLAAQIGKIGLIGVDLKARGKQIGMKLMKAAESYFIQHNISEIDVVTQKFNIPACRFYEKNGYSIKNIEYVFHLWLNK